MEKHLIPFASLTFGKLLGKGQFGSVHQGTLDSQVVAIKKIPQSEETEGVPWDEDTYFKREVEILHSLRHPHVLRFKGICHEENILYIVTEFAEGGDLHKYLKSNVPSWPQRTKIIIQIAQAIQYLHSRSIVHRDIKTENVLMDKDLHVKIADFGFAREVNSGTPSNLTFCGSEFFEAPEIMFCMDYDERIDVFSFGLVICEIISRQAPSMAVFKREVPGFGVTEEEIRKYVEADCPPELVTAAIECCNDNPDKRPDLDFLISDFKVCYKSQTDEGYQDLIDEAVLAKQLEEARLRELEEQELMEVEAKAIFSLTSNMSIRLKNKEGGNKVHVDLFTKPIEEERKLSIDKSPEKLATEKLPDFKKTLKGHEVPDIIRIGQEVLKHKFIQRSNEDQEKWSKFIVGFMKNIPVVDRQVKVKGRIRTFRKCFTSDDVLDCILKLEPELSQRRHLLEVADILVKLTFFFSILGGQSFKEGGLYRFHADEKKMQDGDGKKKPIFANQRPVSLLPTSLLTTKN